MAKFVVLNTICKDGVGDFSHFEDIMKALLSNLKFKNVEFTAIVEFEDRLYGTNAMTHEEMQRRISCNESISENVVGRLRNLGVTYFYRRSGHSVETNTELNIDQVLIEADQGICISHIHGQCWLYMNRLIERGIPVKYIGEHEVTPNIKKITIRGLGLSRDCYGIKIQSAAHLEPYDAWSVLSKNDPEFSTELLAKTSSDSFEAFHQNNIIVPAYFSLNPCAFILFLKFLSLQHVFFGNKNIVIYLSGCNLNISKQEDIEFYFRQLQNTDIEKIELFRPNCTDLAATINPNHKMELLKITIFNGFYVKKSSYDALFSLSKIAGVSGDNTFERCISMNIFPFYLSTNARSKDPTLNALKELTQSRCLALPTDVRRSYNIFFDPHEIEQFYFALISPENVTAYKATENFRRINLQEMIAYWPVVTEYLRRHKNFYNNLEGIILEKLPSNVRNQLVSPIAHSITTRWSNNPFSFLFRQVEPPQQLEPENKKKPEEP